MLSELTLTVMRLGLLVLMWFFVFAVVGVLRGDLYGTRVKHRSAKHAARPPRAAPHRHPHGAARPEKKKGSRAAARARPGSPSPPARSRAPRLPLRPAGTLIGRSPECALVLDDDYASGRHARIFQDDDGTWKVEDLRSTNGTFLGATRLTEPREVAVGSVLRIGQTVVELQR